MLLGFLNTMETESGSSPEFLTFALAFGLLGGFVSFLGLVPASLDEGMLVGAAYIYPEGGLRTCPEVGEQKF